MRYTLWNRDRTASPPKEVRPGRMVIISWVSSMIYDGLWSISAKRKPELLFLKPFLLRIHFLFSKLCHPRSQRKWASVWKHLGPQTRWHFCVEVGHGSPGWNLLQEGRQDPAIPTPSIPEPLLKASASILGYPESPISFPGEHKDSKNNKVRMELRSVPLCRKRVSS